MSKIKQPEAGDDRTSIYAGWLDLANVASSWAMSERLTKFSALFYRRIVCPDSFFHTKGPFARCLYEEATSCGFKLPIPRNPAKIPFFRLLKKGILTPAIRDGDSLYHNFKQGKKGVFPGEFLHLDRLEGEKLLYFVDEVTSSVLPWPNTLDPAVNDKRSRFATALKAVFTAEDSPYCLSDQTLPLHLTDARNSGSLLEINKMLMDFHQVLEDASGNPTFRRLNVEQYIARKLKIQGFPNFYSELVRRVNWRDPLQSLPACYAYMLISVTASAYELMQAFEFSCVAGLFPLHDSGLISQRGLHHSLANFPPSAPLPAPAPVLLDSLDVTDLSWDKILAFRDTDLFDRYCRYLAGTRVPGSKRSFVEENDEFVEFIRESYLPALMKIFPGEGTLVSRLTTSADILSLGSWLVSSAGEAVATIHGIPVLTILKGYSVVKCSSYLPRISSYIRSKRARKRFFANNYAFWEAKTDST